MVDCAAAAASWDFGLVILRYPPSGITPVPLFTGDKAALTAALKAADRKVTQSGYPEDHLNALYSHQDCVVTGWAQNAVLTSATRYSATAARRSYCTRIADGSSLAYKAPPLRLKIAGAPITALYPSPAFAIS